MGEKNELKSRYMIVGTSWNEGKDGIKKQLDKLKKAGRIRHVGATKKGHWEII